MDLDDVRLVKGAKGSMPPDSVAVERAVRDNQPAALARALSAGADPEGGFVGFGHSPLALAAFFCHGSCVALLIKARAKLNQVDGRGRSPLILANDAECAALLIEAGASLNLADDEGFTAVLSAARSGAPLKIRVLGKAKADLEACEHNGRTALMVATINGRSDCVQALLDLDALVDALDPFGRTALIYAARNQQLDAVRLLVSAGADPMIKDEDGYSALDWTRKSNSPDATALLSSAQEAAELRACVKSAPLARIRLGL